MVGIPGKFHTIEGTRTSLRLIKMVTPDIAKAIELIREAKTETRLPEEEELINFYWKALSLLLWVRDGHSDVNWDMVHHMVRD